MKRTLLALIAGLTISVATGLPASASASNTGPTCIYFQNPTVESVWRLVCHF